MNPGKFFAAVLLLAVLAGYRSLSRLADSARGGSAARFTVTLDLAQRDKGLGEAEATARAIEVVRRRLGRLVRGETQVEARGPAALAVEARGAFDPAELKRILARPGRFELRTLDESPAAEDAARAIPAPESSRLPRGEELLYGADGRPHLVGRKAALSGHVSRASAETGSVGPQLVFQLDAEGAALLASFSKANLGRKAAFVVDGVVYSTPKIATPMTNGGAVVEPLSEADARGLAAVLDSGALPAPVKSVEDAR